MKHLETDFVCLPIPTADFLAVVQFLRESQSSVTPSDFFCMAADYFRDNIDMKPDDLGRLIRTPVRGYMWKDLFLPSGSEARMKYKGEWHYASVRDDEFLYQGQPISPSQFANMVTSSSRNAWRDVFVKRPGETGWILADSLRRRSAAKLSTQRSGTPK